MLVCQIAYHHVLHFRSAATTYASRFYAVYLWTTSELGGTLPMKCPWRFSVSAAKVGCRRWSVTTSKPYPAYDGQLMTWHKRRVIGTNELSLLDDDDDDDDDDPILSDVAPFSLSVTINTNFQRRWLIQHLRLFIHLRSCAICNAM